MKEDSKVTLGVMVVMATVTAGLFCFGLYYIQVQNAETDLLLSNLEETTNQEMLIRSLRSLEAESKLSLSDIEHLSFSDENLISVIESLETTGENLGLELSILSVEEIKKNGSEPKKIKIAIQGEGPWRGNFLLFKAVESLPYRILFDDFSLNLLEDGWQSKITFSLYSFN